MILILEDNNDKVVLLMHQFAELFEGRNFLVVKHVDWAIKAWYSGTFDHVFVDYDLGSGCPTGLDFIMRIAPEALKQPTTFYITTMGIDTRTLMLEALRAFGHRIKVWNPYGNPRVTAFDPTQVNCRLGKTSTVGGESKKTLGEVQ